MIQKRGFRRLVNWTVTESAENDHKGGCPVLEFSEYDTYPRLQRINTRSPVQVVCYEEETIYQFRPSLWEIHDSRPPKGLFGSSFPFLLK